MIDQVGQVLMDCLLKRIYIGILLHFLVDDSIDLLHPLIACNATPSYSSGKIWGGRGGGGGGTQLSYMPMDVTGNKGNKGSGTMLCIWIH